MTKNLILCCKTCFSGTKKQKIAHFAQKMSDFFNVFFREINRLICYKMFFIAIKLFTSVAYTEGLYVCSVSFL